MCILCDRVKINKRSFEPFCVNNGSVQWTGVTERGLECEVGERGQLSGWSTGLAIERSRVRIPAGAAGEFSSPGSTFCADSYFGICSTDIRVTDGIT